MSERDRLIKKGIIVPVEFYLNLPPEDERRVKWELKLILLGID